MKRFQLPKPPRSTSKSIRMPNDLICSIEGIISGQDCTFTAFVVEACKVALENLREYPEQMVVQDSRVRETVRTL